MIITRRRWRRVLYPLASQLIHVGAQCRGEDLWGVKPEILRTAEGIRQSLSIRGAWRRRRLLLRRLDEAMFYLFLAGDQGLIDEKRREALRAEIQDVVREIRTKTLTHRSRR